MAGVAALVGAGTSLYSMFNQPDQPGGVAPPQTWQAPNMNGAADAALGGNANLGQYNTWASLLPMYQQAANSAFNNPFAQHYQTRSNWAGDIGYGTGQQQVNAGNSLMGAGQSMLPYAQSILNLGFDPQNALYDRTLQQTTQQQRAGQTARGIAMTPYGAGLENDALKNFNIDWQNNLLNRANTASQGAGYLTNSAGNAINLGQNVGTLGVQQLQNSAALPFNVANTIAGAPLSILGQYGQAGNQAAMLPMAQIENYLKYLGVGNQAGGVANTGYANQIAAQNNQFNQNQKLGSNFGASLQGLSGNNPFAGLSKMFSGFA